MRYFNKYILMDKGEIVCIGITNDLERRCREHCCDKNLTSIQRIGRKTTLEVARSWETGRLETYRNNNKNNPRYNKTKNG